MSSRSWIARIAGSTAVVMSVISLLMLMSWHGNRAPDHLAALQPAVAVERLVERQALDLGVDRAGPRQRDDLRKLADRPPARHVDRALERDVAGPHPETAAAAADVDDVAPRP